MEKFMNEVFNNHFPKKERYGKSHTLYNGLDITLPHIKNKKYNSDFWTHINYHTFNTAISELVKNNKDSYTIVETGCNASCGIKSTNLWDKFVNDFGGEVYSVDLDKNAVDLASSLTSSKTTITCSDSLDFLKKFYKPIDLLYLDSFNVDWNNPEPSAEHHLKEFNIIKYNLHPNSIVLIDDTPKDINWLDLERGHRKIRNLEKKNIQYPIGKGTYVNKILEEHGDELLLHQYQTLWKIKSNF
jgi:hypothetical protein